MAEPTTPPPGRAGGSFHALPPQAELAKALAEISGNLNEHIEERANEIADQRIAEARNEFLEIRTDMEQEAASARQRADDLIAGLRRQLAIQIRRAERLEERLADLTKETTDG